MMKTCYSSQRFLPVLLAIPTVFGPFALLAHARPPLNREEKRRPERTPTSTPENTPEPTARPIRTPRPTPTPRPTLTPDEIEERRLRERLERERERRREAERALQNERWNQYYRDNEVQRLREEVAREQLRLQQELSIRERDAREIEQRQLEEQLRAQNDLQSAINALSTQTQLWEKERTRLETERDEARQSAAKNVELLLEAKSGETRAQTRLESLQSAHETLRTENATLQKLLERQSAEIRRLQLAAQRNQRAAKSTSQPVKGGSKTGVFRPTPSPKARRNN